MEHNPALHLPEAPTWSLIAGGLGKGFVYAACALLVLSALAYALGKPRIHVWAQRGFILGCVCIFGAFASLGSLFVFDQFQYRYVFSHSDALAELRYKVSAIWSGQEGSFLLWACASAIFGLLAAPRTGEYRRWFTVPYALFLGGLAGILAYESPFVLELFEGKALVPPTGAGMAPSLMNYWVTIHPPTIFLGFGSLTVLFCWALSALISGRMDAWIPRVRPWAVISATLLGLGLAMGGFWAYETLGWGGFWAWDPVENVSFVPWCLVVAFLHGIFVQVAQGKWAYGNALLAGMAFLSFVYGTFMTRSGFLGDTSVHSFAEMNRFALWLLIGMLLTGLGTFITVWLMRSTKGPKPLALATDEPLLLNKSNAYGLSVWLMSAFAITAGVGMSYPLLTSLAGQKPAVIEAHVYHLVFVWFFGIAMMAMAIGPWLSWRGLGFRLLASRLSNILALTLGLLGLIVIWIKHPDYGVGLEPGAEIGVPFGQTVPALPLMAVLIGLSLFAFLSNLWLGIERVRRSPASFGGFAMHIGVVVMLSGLIISRGFERTARVGVQDGRPADALGYQIRYLGPTTDNFLDRNNKIRFDVESPTNRFEARPGLYYIPQQEGEPSPMVWPYIEHHRFYDLYLTLGPMVFEATDPITFKPGESKLFEAERILLTYKKMTVDGTPGTEGVKFGAEMLFQSPDGTVTATPTFQVGKNGPVFGEAKLNDDLSARLLRLDAKDRSVTIQLSYTRPLFPIEFFYKPMTILVWAGAGIMAFAGLWVAFYRRFRPREVPVEASEPEIEGLSA